MQLTEKQRTIQQNKALHVFFDKLAIELNNAGLDMRRTLKPGIDIPWEARTVKEYLWRPVQVEQLRKRSTTELNSSEINKIFNTLSRYLGEKFGLELSFPSIESLMELEK